MPPFPCPAGPLSMGDMDLSALLWIDDVRRSLSDEVRGLAAKRESLSAQLMEVDKELEAKRRMLGLLEATALQLIDQGRLHGEAAMEVRQGTWKGKGAHTAIWTSCLSVLHQPPPMDALKLSRRTSPHPMLAIPTAVWEDHLLPLLRCKDAARLGCTCKPLNGVVRDHVRDIGTMGPEKLQAALTAFPQARQVRLEEPSLDWGDGHVTALLGWLRGGRRGWHLETVRSTGKEASDFVHTALQIDALPSLKVLDIKLSHPAARKSLTRGFLGPMRELRLRVTAYQDEDEDLETRNQVAALKRLRDLFVLANLEVEVYDNGVAAGVHVWPFIPASLRRLRLILINDGPTSQALVCALPGMLAASGAGLDRLEIILPTPLNATCDGLVHLAQALRCCSPTLQGFLLTTQSASLHIQGEPGNLASQVERLRVQWADVLAGVSACRELQVLVLPHSAREPLFPRGTAFGRLTHLEISSTGGATLLGPGGMGLWELMMSGGLPALAKLSVMLVGQCIGAVEVKSCLSGALEAVAAPWCTSTSRRQRALPSKGMKWEWGMSWGWQWADCGGSRTSPLTCLKVAGPTTPWPRAWPPVGGTALSPCCGG
jgi:hypothetical protein